MHDHLIVNQYEITYFPLYTGFNLIGVDTYVLKNMDGYV